MKQYRLLRSNKESGPYTAAELIEMGLKPYDLVWLDGRSAAWRYPCEMEEFKEHAPIVEEQPFDRFFKKAPAQKTVQPVTVASTAPASNIATATKPRIRVKADWNRVEQPVTAATKQAAAKEAVAASSTTGNLAAPSWQTSWLDWNEEQKAVGQASKTSYDKPQVKEALQEVQPLLETKFSQSLDSLKQRYAETILKAKNATTFGWGKYKTVAAITLVTVAVLAAGIWLGNNWHSKLNTAALTLTPSVTAAAQPVNSPNVTPPANDENTQTAVSKSPAYSKEVLPDLNAEPVQQPEHTSVNTGAKKYSKPHPAAATSKNTFIKTPAVVQPAKVNAAARPAFIQPKGGGPGTRTKTVNPVVRAQEENNEANNAATVAYKPAKDAGAEPKETAIYTHLSKQARTDDYVNVETYQPNSQTLENYTLSVNNVSDDMVDLVVLDIQYFNVAGKYKSGQTFSVKNIPVNQAATVKLPLIPGAATIKYKISLVSIDKKGVYIIGE